VLDKYIRSILVNFKNTTGTTDLMVILLILKMMILPRRGEKGLRNVGRNF